MPSSHYPSDNLRPIVGNEYVPDTMEARGRIKQGRTDTTGARNGLREVVQSGFPFFTWTFDNLLNYELDWWVSLIGYVAEVDAPYSRRFLTVGAMPAFRLWSGAMLIPTSYKVGILELPMWEEYRNGRFFNVTVNITGLVPGS